MPDSHDDLEPLVTDLAETLEALERRLDAEPGRRQTLLRFTEEYAIPTTVAVLEANIRLLEAVGGAIRMADGRDRGTASGRRRETARTTLDRALSEVSEAVAGTPTDPEARELLAEARSLRDEIRSRIETGAAVEGEESRAIQSSADGTTIPVTDRQTDRATDAESDAGVDEIDVDAELDTIRKEVHGERARGTDEHADQSDDSSERSEATTGGADNAPAEGDDTLDDPDVTPDEADDTPDEGDDRASDRGE